MVKAIDNLKMWAKENIELISMLPENKQLNVTTKLKDILEQEVDEKFFLTQEKADRLLKTVNHDKETTSNDIKPLNDSKKIREQIGFESVNRFYDVEGISPCLNTMSGVGREPKIMVREATKQGYAIAEPGDSINFEHPNSKTRRGRVGKGIANTLTTSCNQGTLDNFRIRKLTPLECFRLQGFPDEAFRAAEQVNSNSQLYKQAGNSVTVNVIEAIAERF